MVVEVKIEVRGLRELQKKMVAVAREVKETDIIKKLTLLAHREIVKATPVNTGRLRASIVPEVLPLYGRVSTFVKYAPFVEFGTRHMEPRHVEGANIRIAGEGYFSYGVRIMKNTVPAHLRELASKIKIAWKSS